MIVVIGSALHRPASGDRPSGAAGLAAGIATAASAGGSVVQLVGRVGEDPAGDATLLALANAGIGHVATLRDAARATEVEPAPVEADPDPREATDLLSEPTIGSADDRSSLRAGDVATLDPDDVGLALSYLDDYRVIVVAEPLSRTGLGIAAEAAAYGGAQLLVVVAGGGAPEPLPADAIVIEAPESDPDGVFARTVATFAVALDRGVDPGAALEGAVASAGWERSVG